MNTMQDRPRRALAGAGLLALSITLASCGKESSEPAQTAPGSLSDAAQPTDAPTTDTRRSAERAVAATNATDPPRTPPSTPAPTPTTTTSEPYVAGITWTPPAGWLVVPTDGAMRKAQYTAAAPAGSGLASGEVVFFHFGVSGQGGTVEDNIDRWSSQMLDASGEPVPPVVVAFELSDGLHVTSAAYTGTYLSGMPAGPTTPVENTTLLGAIVEGGPMGGVYIRFTGPVPVVDAHREAWELMIRSFRLADDPAK